MVWSGIQKPNVLSTSTLTPIYGGGGWDPCSVRQPNYFVLFVFYIGNVHFWTGGASLPFFENQKKFSNFRKKALIVSILILNLLFKM